MSSDLQKKLARFEAEPAPKVWSNIETVLDSEAQFPNRLYEFEAQPNPQTWQKIASVLPAPVVPFHIRYRKPLRYSTAAAILILLTLSTTLLISKKTNSETASISLPSTTTQTTPIPGHNEILTQEPDIITAQIADNKIEANNNKAVFAKETLGAIPSKNILADNVTPECLIAEVKDKINHLDLKTSDRFMVYCCDGYGNPMKLPKKLYDVVNCGEEDPSCRQNIQCLQEKISSATLTTDFIGVLQIIRQVQENQ